MATILVTGGAGFIGGAFVRQWLAEESECIVNLDALTYAGNLDSLESIADNPRHVFVKGDIGDLPCLTKLLAEHRPRGIEHAQRSRTWIVPLMGQPNSSARTWSARFAC